MKMRSIYRKIAKKHGVSVSEVKCEMKAAIDYAYKQNDKSESEKVIQESISSNGEEPNTDEFIKRNSISM